MSVMVSGPKQGEMQFELDKILITEDIRALESTIRKRAHIQWFRRGAHEIHLKVDVGALSGNNAVQALEKIHKSILDQIAHRTANAKEKASALT